MENNKDITYYQDEFAKLYSNLRKNIALKESDKAVNCIEDIKESLNRTVEFINKEYTDNYERKKAIKSFMRFISEVLKSPTGDSNITRRINSIIKVIFLEGTIRLDAISKLDNRLPPII